MAKANWKHFKSPTNQRRNIVVSFRVTEKENSLLREGASAANLSIADYVLSQTIYSNRDYVFVDRELLNTLIKELVKVDVNFNQATRALNTAINHEHNSKSAREHFARALKIIDDEHEQRTIALKNISLLLEQTFKR